MAEEAATSAPVVTAPVADVAPVVSAPSVETSAPAVTPAVETAVPVAETAPVPAETAPLLNPEAPEVKTEEAPKVEEAKVEAEPAVLPTYEFKLPEGVDAENTKFKDFTSKLGEFQNLSKAEQATVQKFGQEMIDLHVQELKAAAENSNKLAWDWFNNRNKEWLDNAKKDPSIGGEAWNDTISSASKAVSLYGGDKAQQLEVAKLFQETGVENHPALLRFLSNITKTAAKESTPVASRTVPTAKPGIAEAMYGGKKIS